MDFTQQEPDRRSPIIPVVQIWMRSWMQINSGLQFKKHFSEKGRYPMQSMAIFYSWFQN